MEGAEQMLLEQILANQNEQGRKIDGIRTDVNQIRMEMSSQERRILDAAGKRFVKHDEFPNLWERELCAKQKRDIEALGRVTTVAGYIRTWAGWLLAVGGAVAAIGTKAGWF